jgi:hypothetical protein
MAHLPRRQQAVTTFCFHGSISTVTFCIQTHRQLGGTVYQPADCSVLVEPWVKGKHVASVMVRVFTVLSVDNVKVKRATKESSSDCSCMRTAIGPTAVPLCSHHSKHVQYTKPIFSSTHRAARIGPGSAQLCAWTALMTERPGCKRLQRCYLESSSVHPVRRTIPPKIQKNRSPKLSSAHQQLNEL